MNCYNYKKENCKEFKFINQSNHLGQLLGFTQNKYSGKNTYKSEKEHRIVKVDKIYLFVEKGAF